MHIVVIDSSKLAGEADFPMLDMPKYGWQQFVQLEQAEVADRCWRSDVIISVATPVTREVIDRSFKLRPLLLRVTTRLILIGLRPGNAASRSIRRQNYIPATLFTARQYAIRS